MKKKNAIMLFSVGTDDVYDSNFGKRKRRR